MKLAPVSFQTNIRFFLPFLFSLFNIYLASANVVSGFVTHPASSSPGPLVSRSFPNLSEVSAAWSPDRPGKVIKDTEHRKTDYRIKTVVIDPGHGGHDPGCLGSNAREKHLALAVGLKLTENIRKNFPDIRVIMTRDADVFIPLYERAAIANRNNADLFISIHCNAMPKGNGHIYGSETYVMGLHTAEHNLNVAKRENASILLEADYEKNYDYDPNSPEGHIMLSIFQNVYLEQSILFADLVENMIHQSAQRKSRGVKQAGFVVLKETTMPSVLIETGFLSNEQDEAFLSTEEGQTSMADAIYQAFSAYKTSIETGTGSGRAASFAQAAPPEESNKRASPILTKVEEKSKTVEKPITNDLPKPQTLVFQEPSFSAEGPGAKTTVNQSPSNHHSASPNVEPKIITLQGTRAGNETTALPAERPTAIAAVAKPSTADVQFFVQLAASQKPINTDTPKWRALDYLVEVVLENDLFKYQARQFHNFQQAAEARLTLQQKGFPDAFIVAYRNGARISMDEAKKLLGMQ